MNRRELDEVAELLSFAYPGQLDKLQAVVNEGGIRQAARKLGVNYTSVYGTVQAVKRRAALMGHSPQHDMTRTVPDGFKVKGISTYYNKEGEMAGQWVKSDEDRERRELFVREALKALAEEVRGLSPLRKAPAKVEKDLLAVYPLGDPHFGMYAWAKETGEDFDLKEAKRLTLGAVDRLVQSAPAADTAIVLPLGDIFHANDQTNQTPAHKNQLDVDTRFVQVLQVGVAAFRHVVLRALEKHKRVICRFVAGNHDPEAVWALAFSIAAYFENEPRVTVDLSPSKHWFYRHGKVLIGATHGDTVKHDQLLGVMATLQAEDWGQTKHRYWYTGHIHKTTVNEYPGVVCESFRTLAARDAFAAGRGYLAGRDMRCIVHHLEHGEIERHRCDVGMVD